MSLLLTLPMTFCRPEKYRGSLALWNSDLPLSRNEVQSRFQCGPPQIGHGAGGTAVRLGDIGLEYGIFGLLMAWISTCDISIVFASSNVV